MSLLVESIKVEDGKLLNINFHNERMNRTLYDLFRKKSSADLEKIIEVPQSALKGVFKCRVIYDEKNIESEFSPYSMRHIRSLKLVHDDCISYSYKYIDRTNITRLMDLREGCDDILIIKNGKVTDSSYANVIFRNIDGKWVTPSTFLLMGTRRSALLNSRLITKTDISATDLHLYSEVRLINAMIGIEDSESIPVSQLI
jgi:4-amino-4-deoxychorismate lyase